MDNFGTNLPLQGGDGAGVMKKTQKRREEREK
jgi:hypothetical protein